jgi:hypothetical protein
MGLARFPSDVDETSSEPDQEHRAVRERYEVPGMLFMMMEDDGDNSKQKIMFLFSSARRVAFLQLMAVFNQQACRGDLHVECRSNICRYDPYQQ